ncbi:Smr/MutS family protein [Aegicerativicinus sediminis]|uniref:Smr/MutS family protein n=1 Tax=Aegicerativicinus sediminis TaxID=2893202 RepID=UPI001E54095E|nr:Smr/MutS family protein [Aegicerativicinus sediminis]
MKRFKKGDWVSALDEDFEGAVTSVKGDSVFVEDENGFELEFRANDLVLMKTDHLDSVFSKHSFQSVMSEKDANTKRQKPTILKTKKQSILKVDLHSSEILESEKGMTPFEILEFQLNTAKRQLDFAIDKKIPKLIIIHGVGEGVLKMEIDTILRRYDNIEFFDADYKTYGYGATEVRIFQNPAN